MRCIPVLFAALAAVACGSDKAAAPKFVVTLDGPASVLGVQTSQPGYAALECVYSVTATATGGSAGDEATWGTGRATFVRQDGAISESLIQNASSYVGGGATLVTGQSATGNGDYVYWNEPFQYTMVLYFSTPNTPKDSASYTLACQQ